MALSIYAVDMYSVCVHTSTENTTGIIFLCFFFTETNNIVETTAKSDDKLHAAEYEKPCVNFVKNRVGYDVWKMNVEINAICLFILSRAWILNG